MRQLRFRAWNGEQMISPDYIDRNGIAFWKENSIPTKSDKVMQYTGVNDCNGNDIYEGDIVKLVNASNQSHCDHMQGIGVVTWEEYECSFAALRDKFTYMSMTWGGTESIEIIGNIYANPSLL